MDLGFEDGSCLCKGDMGGVLRAEGERLWEALGSRPEEAACAGGGILREGVHQLGYALMKLELQHIFEQVQQQ